MQCVAISIGRGTARFQIVDFSFVHHHEVSHFDHSAFDALDVVPRAANQHQHKHVDHASDGHFTLPDSNGFNQNQVVARGFAKLNRFRCRPRDATQGRRRSRGSDEGIRMLGEVEHPGFVAEQ